MTSVIELYPAPGMSRPLHGLYLDQDLRQTAGADGFVYTNFISSLDGRIAMPGPNDRPRVPPAIANAKDWRLFQELAAQADVLLTSGRYLREYHPTNSQDVLAPYADPALRDLEQWRLARGLAGLSGHRRPQCQPRFRHTRSTADPAPAGIGIHRG